MKLRITPLNIVSAIGLGLVVVNLVSEKNTAPRHVNMDGFYLLILGCLILVTFITDMIFRFTLKDIKRIWVVELIFVVIAAVLMLILQKVA
jgi:O-antigen/teichoic acid export membrane protein